MRAKCARMSLSTVTLKTPMPAMTGRRLAEVNRGARHIRPGSRLHRPSSCQEKLTRVWLWTVVGPIESRDSNPTTGCSSGLDSENTRHKQDHARPYGKHRTPIGAFAVATNSFHVSSRYKAGPCLRVASKIGASINPCSIRFALCSSVRNATMHLSDVVHGTIAEDRPLQAVHLGTNTLKRSNGGCDELSAIGLCRYSVL